MDTATPLVYRHAQRIPRWLALAALGLCAAALLVSVVQLITGGSPGPTPEVPLLGPFRWDKDGPSNMG